MARMGLIHGPPGRATNPHTTQHVEATMQDEQSAMERLATDPSDRRRFLKAVGGTAGAGAFALFLAACGNDSKSSGSSSTAATSTQQATKATTGTEMFGA